MHGFPAPFWQRFSALTCGVIAVYPMQTVLRFSRCNRQNGNKKAVTEQTLSLIHIFFFQDAVHTDAFQCVEQKMGIDLAVDVYKRQVFGFVVLKGHYPACQWNIIKYDAVYKNCLLYTSRCV